MARILGFVFLLAAAAHGGVPWESSFGKAKQRALKEDKLLFLVYYAEECEPYEEMERDTFPRPEVQAWLNSVVCARVNAESLEGSELATKHGIEGVPTIVLFEPGGRIVYNQGGRPVPEQFVDFFGMTAYNAAVDACNLDNPKGAAHHLFFVRKWFGSTNIGKHADELYRTVEKAEGFAEAYEAARKEYEEGLAEARKADEAKREKAREASRKAEERVKTAKALKAEADDLMKKYMRTKAYDLYRKILAEYPDLPEGKEAKRILTENKQKLTK